MVQQVERSNAMQQISYLEEPSKVQNHHCALVHTMQCAVLVCFCVLQLTCSELGQLWQGLALGRTLNKFHPEHVFSIGRSNTIWDDHKEACLPGLFIALLCFGNLIVWMVFSVLGNIVMLIQSQILRRICIL